MDISHLEDLSQDLRTNNIEDKKNLTKTLMNEIQCQCCLQVPDQLYNTSCCQQYLCDQCLKKIQKCLICRNQFQIIDNKSTQRILELVICECINENCRFQSSFMQVLRHQKSCEFQKFKCKHQMATRIEMNY
ncbi:hypothetical protein ABPG73_018016 [Tetrahymena malaccensis]